jgi:hypothetical protein
MDGESPFREGGGDPDAEAREMLAIQRYGAWSGAVRGRIIAISAGVGVVGAIATIVVMIYLAAQLPLIAAVVAAGAVGAASVATGRVIGRKAVHQRAPQKLLELSAAHEVPVDRLEKTTSLSNQL